jgi:2-hydroxychromene-2-carboxylate isomerase
MSTPHPIEFWFEFGSNYSYLSVMRIESMARDVPINWRPFLLGPIFQQLGFNTSPFVLQKAKGDYVWRDMERQCQKYGLPWSKPSRFPRTGLLPIRVALAGVNEPWVGDYCRRMMMRNFVDDQDIDSVAAVTDVLESMSLDAAPIVERATTDHNKQRLRSQTEAAYAKGIFGAPTFFVKGEMFWGNDRLEDALEYAHTAAE